MRVRGPRAELIAVVSELIRNATLAISGVSVTVSTYLDGAFVVVDVADDGPGVAPDVVSRIFQHGFSTRGGSGQGLALAKEIVERAFGGTIRYEPGRVSGARFLLRLPVTSEVENP